MASKLMATVLEGQDIYEQAGIKGMKINFRKQG